MFDLGEEKKNKTNQKPENQSNSTNQKISLERETRKILNDFSSRPHICEDECFLLCTPICSGRSSGIWTTNSSNLVGAGACETSTSCTQRWNAVWTICCEGRSRAIDSSRPPSRSVPLTGFMPACWTGAFGKSLLPVQRSYKPWCLPPFCWRREGMIGDLAGGGSQSVCLGKLAELVCRLFCPLWY